MKKVCRYCGRVHDKKMECKRPANWRSKNHANRQETLRGTNRWKKKSIEIRERDHYLCQACLHLEERLNYKELSVHHIVPIAEDETQAFEDENLITLCDYHHEQAEKGYIERRVLKRIARSNIPPGIEG